MKKLLTVLLCIVTIFALSACPRQPTVQEQTAADYGPFPENYEELIIGEMKHRLFDPYSAQYDFLGPPTRGYHAESFGGDITYGYSGAVLINAKNRFGAYVGATKFGYLIRYGRVAVLKENPRFAK
jgi:hypothetical protein